MGKGRKKQKRNKKETGKTNQDGRCFLGKGSFLQSTANAGAAAAARPAPACLRGLCLVLGPEWR